MHALVDRFLFQDKRPVLIPTRGPRSRRDGLKNGVRVKRRSRSPAPPPPNIHTRVPSAFPRTPLCPPATRPRPFALAARTAPSPARLRFGRRPSPSGSPAPPRGSPRSDSVLEHNPGPAGPAHPEAGGASSSSQSASRAPRPARVRRRLWAKAPHAASQEEARVSGGGSATRVRSRSPFGHPRTRPAPEPLFIALNLRQIEGR